MDKKLLSEILDQVRMHKSIAIRTEVQGTEGKTAEGISVSLVPVHPVMDRKGRSYASVLYSVDENTGITTVEEPVLPRERLVILGGGHVAVPIAEFAVKCDFHVVVVDDRPEFANADRFSMAQEVICAPFEEAIENLSITPFDYIVIVTRGHAWDRHCLRKVLEGTEPAYTGMIGSKSRVRKVLDQLIEEGYDEGRIERVCTPIGLSIGADTPAEIAVSILAELITYKRMPEHTKGRLCNDTDLTLDVLEHMAVCEKPEAVVTILTSKGSTPRKAGSKMTVDAEGKIHGSIGGGLGEATAIKTAMEMVGSGNYRICYFDMTGDVAAEEGMVCGGIMKVLIES